MMRVTIVRRSIRSGYLLRDDRGVIRARARRPLFSSGRRWVISDATGLEIGSLHRTESKRRQSVDLTVGSEKYTVRRALLTVRPEYVVVSKGGTIVIQRGALSHHWKVQRQGFTIAVIRRRRGLGRLAYQASVSSSAEHRLIFGVVLAIEHTGL